MWRRKGRFWHLYIYTAPALNRVSWQFSRCQKYKNQLGMQSEKWEKRTGLESPHWGGSWGPEEHRLQPSPTVTSGRCLLALPPFLSILFLPILCFSRVPMAQALRPPSFPPQPHFLTLRIFLLDTFTQKTFLNPELKYSLCLHLCWALCCGSELWFRTGVESVVLEPCWHGSLPCSLCYLLGAWL